MISDVTGLPIGKNKGSAGMRISAAFLVAQLVEHEFGLVVELYGKPVPTNQTIVQLVAGKFMVHPTGSLDLDRLSFEK